MRKASLVLAAAFLAGAAHAADYPPPIALAVQSGSEVVKSFPAPDGLTGWVLNIRGQHMTVAYTTPSGEHMMLGALVNSEGYNLTKDHTEAHVPKPDYSAQWKALENATYVIEGNPQSTNIVYVFTDPNCPYCYFFNKASHPYLDGDVQIRNVFVAFKKGSAGKVATVLDAEDPAAALWQNTQNFRDGGVKASEVSDKLRAKLAENEQLMESFGLRGTPGIVYQNSDGEVVTQAGMPSLRHLPVILGLDPIPNDDPELARFK